ncbi:MAG: hypothetical protein HC844_10220 [Tabrizicola sp.]|nr:hypothetical protein [Tabrizicola sp.]
MRILDTLMMAAAGGTLTEATFAQFWRSRRSNASYLNALLGAAHRNGHPELEYMLCKNVTRRLNAPRFERRLKELTGL